MAEDLKLLGAALLHALGSINNGNLGSSILRATTVNPISWVDGVGLRVGAFLLPHRNLLTFVDAVCMMINADD